MPFVRFSRDKRGYEHVTLVHVATRRGRPSRPRILYWFRTPPAVKVGREPFDEAVRRALEAQYPDVIFDWKKIVQARMPPVEIEPWRERRRAEREAKQARREQEMSQSPPAGQPTPAPAAEAPALELPAPAAPVTAAPADPASPGAAPANSSRRRRRRLGGRRRGGMPESSQAPRRAGSGRNLQSRGVGRRTMRGRKRRDGHRQTWHNLLAMTLKANGLWSTAAWVGLVAGLSAQTPAKPVGQDPQETPTFRVQIDAVTMDVVVKDSEGRFVADLRKDEFEIFEDGVQQEIMSMTMSHGGRVTNVLEAPPPPAPEGIILPPRKVVNDTSGRIFLFFVDDLHLQFQGSGRVRELFKKVSRNLLHEGDLFGIVSSGPSSIAIDMTYDKRRMDYAISKIHGDGKKPSDIIQSTSSSGGSSELRYRAQVAFSTMLEGLRNLERVTNRRKALVWVSEGYDFNPFQDSRLGLLGPRSPFLQNQTQFMANEAAGGAQHPLMDPQVQSETFSDADLAFSLGEITRAANRANTTIYTIDPRGLVAGTDIDEAVDPMEWDQYLRKSQDTLRVLAEETGGLAVVNQNDFDKALKRIDAESSDYYVLGYYSNDPDPTRRRRQISVRVTRKDVEVFSRKEYVFKAPPPPPARP